MAPSLLSFPVLANAKVPETCGPAVTLKLSAPFSRQGGLLLLEVRSRKPLAEVTAEWNSKNAPFWQVVRIGDSTDSSKVATTDTRQTILGVDLEKAPGTYPLVVHLQTASGKPETCTLQIPIRTGKFATERLQVGKQFVEPSPEQIQRANEERDKLRAIFDQVTPEKLWDGDFRVPLDGVTNGGNFGKRRVLNGQPGSPHSGVDFPAVTGTPVHAAQNGRVTLAQELFFSGNTVVVDHGLGIYTFYGHLSEIDVKTGDELKSGEVLGKVGATGRVTGPHLHWGLTVERARVNPLQLVKLFGSGSEAPVRPKTAAPR
ncbi:MAG TPA: M23 family metallopeptidase [Candidatus Acidoferrum sp.]|nr:M23 family metallopeptidase [Candidatus Acidoferrum sp.]